MYFLFDFVVFYKLFMHNTMHKKTMQCLSKFPTWPTHPFTPVLMKKRKAINMVRCNQLWLWFVAYRNPLARIFHWEPGSRIVRKKGETLPSSIPQYLTHNHAQWTKKLWHSGQIEFNILFCFKFRAKTGQSSDESDFIANLLEILPLCFKGWSLVSCPL